MMIEDQSRSHLYYVTTDYLGSICGLMDANGNMVEEYSYDGCSVKSGFWKWSATETVIEPITLRRVNLLQTNLNFPTSAEGGFGNVDTA